MSPGRLQLLSVYWPISRQTRNSAEAIVWYLRDQDRQWPRHVFTLAHGLSMILPSSYYTRTRMCSRARPGLRHHVVKRRISAWFAELGSGDRHLWLPGVSADRCYSSWQHRGAYKVFAWSRVKRRLRWRGSWGLRKLLNLKRSSHVCDILVRVTLVRLWG